MWHVKRVHWNTNTPIQSHTKLLIKRPRHCSGDRFPNSSGATGSKAWGLMDLFSLPTFLRHTPAYPYLKSIKRPPTIREYEASQNCNQSPPRTSAEVVNGPRLVGIRDPKSVDSPSRRSFVSAVTRGEVVVMTNWLGTGCKRLLNACI